MSASQDTPGQGPGAELIQIRFLVPPRYHGWRLDTFVHSRIPRLSRNRIQKMIHAQQSLGAAPLRPAMRVRAEQEVVLLRPAPQEPDVPRTFEVLYSDEAVLAIHKPAGLPVHATARYHKNTLTAVLRERYGADGGYVPSLAHRLDRETSGLMLLGRTRQASVALKRAFRLREVHKRYLALVHGQPPAEFAADDPLGPDVASGIRVKMGVVPNGQPASTRFVTLEQRGDFALVQAQPVTGRQHQIRAHLQACGYPVVGDKLYGPDPGCLLEYLETGWTDALAERLLLARHALHAAAATFPHPTSGDPTTIECPLPADLQEFWDSPMRLP